MTPAYVFAVDGGGSKTEAELLTPDGTSLAAARTGPCNLYQDAASGLAAVMQAWRECCARASLDPVATASQTVISAALAGTGAAPGRARFYEETRAFAAAHLSSDAYAALLGAFDGGPGILLSIGTGTIACRLDQAGRFERRGGWGFPAGDRGSGAWLGLQAVTSWLEVRDGLDPVLAEDEPLWAEIERAAGLDRTAILAWLRAATQADYARLAPSVLGAAERGSKWAGALVDEAVQHAERLVRSLAAPSMPIALNGGLADSFAPQLQSRLRQGIGRAPSPLRGALLVATGRMPPEFGR